MAKSLSRQAKALGLTEENESEKPKKRVVKPVPPVVVPPPPVVAPVVPAPVVQAPAKPEPVVAKKRPRYVREQKAPQPESKPAPLPPRSNKRVAKILTAKLALPPKDDPPLKR